LSLALINLSEASFFFVKFFAGGTPTIGLITLPVFSPADFPNVNNF